MLFQLDIFDGLDHLEASVAGVQGMCSAVAALCLRVSCAVLSQVEWFPNGEQLVTSSADKSVRCWDAEAGMQIKRLTEHSSIVNGVNPLARGPQLFVSGSDDSKVKVRRQP